MRLYSFSYTPQSGKAEWGIDGDLVQTIRRCLDPCERWLAAVKGKSILAQAAEFDSGDVKLEFWWRDPDRLLARVMALAEADPKFRRLMRAKVGKLASSDEDFRLELRKDLDAIGQKKPGRRSPYGPFFREYVAGFVEWIVSNGHAANLPDAFVKVAEIERQRFPDLTDEAVRGLYQRARVARKGRKKHENP